MQMKISYTPILDKPSFYDIVSSRFAVTPCVISTIAKLRYRFSKEPNRTTRISTVAK